jgi:LmbE family N-acetylglucosaminyl deacetylase
MKALPLLDAFDWPSLERVIILSPHLDDSALSCGETLRALLGHVSRLSVTIASGNPPSKGKKSRNRSAYAPPAQRRREDIAAMQSVDCDFVHLGFADCIYRRSPTTGDLIYRSPRTRFAKPSIDDSTHVEELFLVLRRLVHNMGKVLLLSPLGIGYHVDHVICAQLALRLASSRVQLLFYEDFPYVVDPELGQGFPDGPLAALERLGCVPAARYFVPVHAEKKAQLIQYYQSQVPMLFSDVGQMEWALRRRRHKGEAVELFWKARLMRPQDSLQAEENGP